MSAEQHRLDLPWPEFSTSIQLADVLFLERFGVLVGGATASENGIAITYEGPQLTDSMVRDLRNHLLTVRRKQIHDQAFKREPDEKMLAFLNESDDNNAAIVGAEPSAFPGLEVVFSEDLSPEQVTEALTALAEFFRECGGLGFEVDFEYQGVQGKVPAHV